ncbi:hypothetical protein LSG31_00315 [Fodinisporobacter ferrooxydans]|uniref:Uncharacterized protein n=1 Tax=Fodinisporobacter ferrooxydans TaxID=2901836 RepID=A0ABY4CJR4_9BACL|nr:hypothetical protein LSG31_00315 [Alicyclobacillaceae bacterium MYW30-H2]
MPDAMGGSDLARSAYGDSPAPDSTGNSVQSYTLPSVTLAKAPGILFNAGSLSNARFDQYTIKMKVTLYHNGTAYDVTPYIMQLKTHMSLGEPSGRFTILTSFQKRWDLFAQPQDYVEIRFSRYLPDPPIIMRGLVGNVRRTRIMDSSGKLQRAITINGENYGKIWNKYQINYLVNQPGMQSGGTDTDPAIGLMGAQLYENYGIGANGNGDIAPADLMQGITNVMLNKQIQAMQQVNPQMPLLKLISNILPDYFINGFQLQQAQGSVYSLVQQFGNSPWCEFFIDEAWDAPVFFFRNTPFTTSDGKLVWQESLPDTTYFLHPHIRDYDIIQEDVGHSDSEVYSYFFTYPANFYADQLAFKSIAIIREQITNINRESDSSNITNPYVDLDNLYRYGFQLLQIGSPLIPSESPDGGLQLSIKMNQWLAKSFGWAAQMLNGTLLLKGNEHMRIGRYFTNDSTNETYYIESVDHSITIGQAGSNGGDNVFSFQTSVGVIRGHSGL